MIKKLYKSMLSGKKRIAIRLRFEKMTAFLYKGNDFECNCCGNTFRKLKPKGNIPRKNAKCPYCGSLERTRVLMFYIEEETDIFTDNPCKVLHFAPEWSLIPIFNQCDSIEYIDADINPDFANHLFNIESIPYPNDYFDYIICSHVLGHVSNEQKAIEEMYRVLKPDGKALIMTILDRKRTQTFEDASITTPEERLKHYSEPDLLRLHGLDFAQRLAHCFEVEENDYRKSFKESFQKRFSLGDGDREIIFICTK